MHKKKPKCRADCSDGMKLLLVVLLSTVCEAWRFHRQTRTVHLAQGTLVGMILESEEPGLGNVDVYLGIPYASAERYMPPSSPARFKWMDANMMGPICPQAIPKVNYERNSSSLRRLDPFLNRQSEDCLNLNIYAPSSGYQNILGRNLPVIVFIHGESFSWNSGNAYDGSTLASYGNVIFVTLNFRLGVLGFLKPSLEEKVTSNFGLLDMIAALRWLKDNIIEFGGDPHSITLMGHHTGAIAVNYLMLSPVSQADNGLFQRAILMSGTALSSWSEVKHPEESARALAEQLKCPMDDLTNCLREKDWDELVHVRLPEDPAPTVDGVVVLNHPKDLMSHNTGLFTGYDLLCGVTESESYHILDTIALNNGLEDQEKEDVLARFFKKNFGSQWRTAKDRASGVYDLHSPRMSPLKARDNTLTLLSDARIVAPVFQMATYHATAAQGNIKTFVYVFSHRSKHLDHPLALHNAQGENLAYVLGEPLESGRFGSSIYYNRPEKHLSETMMSLWTNFAKTGNPNLPARTNYLTPGPVEWKLRDISWEPYEPINRTSFKIEIPPQLEYRYRYNFLDFWDHTLPMFLRNVGHHDFKPLYGPTKPLVYESCLELERPWKKQVPPGFGRLVPEWEALYPKPKPFSPLNPNPSKRTEIRPIMDKSPPTTQQSEEGTDSPPEATSASAFTFTMVILVGVCFLIINIFFFLFIWYQKKKFQKARLMSRYNRRESSPSLPEIEYDKKEDKCEIKSILKSNERLYDHNKVKTSTLGKWTGMYSQGSSSTVTMDPHTKVSQWMSREKVSTHSKVKTDKSSETAGSSGTTSKGSKGKVKKVSVAVDATPSARSASVLKQTPIELTKSMDFGKRRLGATLKPLHRSEAIDPEESAAAPNHSHSNSDPAQLLSTDIKLKEEKVLKTFGSYSKDINVTCRDDDEVASTCSQDALDNIKRRNYPKVLPDFPERQVTLEGENTRTKRMSLPVATPVIDPKKIPPPPPPRYTPTSIARRPSNRNTIPNFMTSYAQLKPQSDSEETSQNDEKGSSEKFIKEEKRMEKKVEKRPEPKVIIKPTLTDPNLKKTNSKIPRVTHQPDSGKEQKRTTKETKQVSKTKAPPLKKSVGTDSSGNTSGSSVSSIATVRKVQRD
nr:neuroligin-4, Y-linked-like isoform X3 [Halyomorpha halys]